MIPNLISRAKNSNYLEHVNYFNKYTLNSLEWVIWLSTVEYSDLKNKVQCIVYCGIKLSSLMMISWHYFSLQLDKLETIYQLWEISPSKILFSYNISYFLPFEKNLCIPSTNILNVIFFGLLATNYNCFILQILKNLTNIFFLFFFNKTVSILCKWEFFQIYAEGMHLIQVGGEILNTTLISNPDIDWVPQQWEESVNSVLDNAYTYGRSAISDSVSFEFYHKLGLYFTIIFYYRFENLWKIWSLLRLSSWKKKFWNYGTGYIKPGWCREIKPILSAQSSIRKLPMASGKVCKTDLENQFFVSKIKKYLCNHSVNAYY